MKKSTSEIWREGQAKAGLKQSEPKSQWEIDVQEFDEEIELINKKILIVATPNVQKNFELQLFDKTKFIINVKINCMVSLLP